MDGRAVAAALVLLGGPTAYYYLAALDVSARQTCAMNALIVRTAGRLHEMGLTRFHLGGGAGGVSAFKERFGPGRVPYFVAKAVFDRERYEHLCDGIATEFFPAYRAAAKA